MPGYVCFLGQIKTLSCNLDYLSKKHTRNTGLLMIQKDWILLSCSGSIGRTVYTNEDFEGQIGTHDLIRIIPNEDKVPSGYLYAFLSSKHGFSLLTQGTYGGVIQHIEPHHIADLPVPLLPDAEQQQIHEQIEEASRLRVEANRALREARGKLLDACQLKPLTTDDYESYGAGQHAPSTFALRCVNSTSLAAFNYSERINRLQERVKANATTKPLRECLTRMFSTGSFKRWELNSPRSIELINQSDIFDTRIKGKLLANVFVKNQALVEYGEVLIAGVGTLGENETFCRALFAGEQLEGKLISGEFIRMQTTDEVPPGYLYAWLSSDYGFRMLRATQSGTKLCRPIPRLLSQIPVPILEKDIMKEIDSTVKEAHAKRFEALQLENAAITHIERAIESWQD